MSAKHSLTAKDKAALTATCSVCGPGVEIKKTGRYFVCLTARREARRNWKKAHPGKARAWSNSGHNLENRDGLPDKCSRCGPVEVKAWGRGWICANLLAEKKWTTTQTEPAPKCKVCVKLWLVDGKCPECDAPPERDLIQKRTIDWFEAHLKEAGLTIQADEPWLSSEQETAVPGWKTLGSLDPAPSGVRPEYAALYGSGKR